MSAPERVTLIHDWLRRQLGARDYRLEPASSDASARRYFRVTLGQTTRVVMDAPPERQALGPYLDVTGRLALAGLHVPEVLAADLALGVLLLGDLGTRPYLGELTSETVEALYGDALEALYRMQIGVDTEGLPDYGAPLLHAEMDLFPAWFLGRHLGIRLTGAQQETLAGQFRHLVDSALAQPRTFVHLDYHSRNLMVTPERNPGVLDFQDAVLGPVTYDLVSLLRDCYIAWPEARVDAWVAAHHARLVRGGVVPAGVDLGRFSVWLDLMGVQRHLKAIGIFARLWHRDSKPGYLKDIPRTLAYIYRVAARHRPLTPLLALFEELSLAQRAEHACR